MKVLFAGDVHVDYGQIYVRSGDGDLPAGAFELQFGGQTNGLCAAAMPGFLHLVTGTHTGVVPFTVELHDTAPPLDPLWEDVVEASYRPVGAPVDFLEWQGAAWPLDLEARDYRVRYCARGMDKAGAFHVRPVSEVEIDRYLLQFWPAAPSPDEVVKQITAKAAYWHEYARSLPPPPPPLTDEEKAELARQQERRHAEWLRQLDIDTYWGGVAPPEALLALGGNAAALANLDRPLLEAIAEAEPDEQRRIARWAARQACDAAGVADLDWVESALDALDRGDELPPPFDDHAAVSRLLHGDREVAAVVVSAVIAPPNLTLPRIWPPAAAVAAVWNVAEEDPLHAAVFALGHAAITAGDDYARLFRDLRRAFAVPPG